MLSKPIEIAERLSLKSSPAKTLPLGPKYSRKAAAAAAVGGLFVFSFATIYRVRELMAALLLFSVAFAVVMMGAFILWLAEQAAHEAAMWLESRTAHLPSRAVAAAPVRAKHNAAGRTWN